MHLSIAVTITCLEMRRKMKKETKQALHYHFEFSTDEVFEGEYLYLIQQITNESDEARFAPIIVKYGNSEKQIMVKQLSHNEAALKATHFGGEYYGSIYSPGMGNYYLFLSDNGFNDKGMDMPNSKYYCMDLYGPLYEGPDGGEITLPIGTYTLNTGNDPQMWTMGWEYSHYRETDSTGMSPEEVALSNATLVVTEDGATLECSTAGIKHRVVFSGQATIIDARY